MMSASLANKQVQFSDFYDSISPEEKYDLGKKQWEAMRKIEAEFNSKPMTQFGNVTFSSDKWPISNRRGPFTGFNWFNIHRNDTSYYPLVLMLKLCLYHRVEVQKYSASSYERVIGFARTFLPYLKNTRVLFGRENSPIVPAEFVDTETIEKWCNDLAINGARDADVWRYWQSLILNGSKILPPELSFLRFDFKVPWAGVASSGEPLTAEQRYLNKLLGNDATRTSVNSYKPFSAKSIALLIDNAIPIFTNHADSFIEIFETFSMYFPVGKSGKEALKSSDFCIKSYKQKMQEVIEKHQNVLNLFPDSSIPSDVVINNNNASNLGILWVSDLHRLCVAASVWIILLTTGLRNVDIRKSLLRDCVVPDPEEDLLNYLVTDLTKVSIIDHPIPIPPLTIQAIEFLNKINLSPEHSPCLVSRISGIKQVQGWGFSTGWQLSCALRDFAKAYGIDLLDDLEEEDNQEGVAHRARVTLANWIGTNSPLAVLIVKRLFGHTNEIMPDHYLRHNKAVIDEREKIQRQTYEDLSDEVSEAIVDGKFSGGLKQKIAEDLKEVKENLRCKNSSLVGNELRKTLKEHIKNILIKRLSNGESLGLQTPLGFVCMRNPQSTKPAPCSAKSQTQKLKDSEIGKRFMRALQASTLPDLENCQGPECQHSLLFDNPVTQILLETFHYYANYLRGVGTFRVNHLDIEAQNFINLYYPPLKDVYPEIEKIVIDGDIQ